MKKAYLLLLIIAATMLASCTSEYHYANAYLRKFKFNRKSATEQIYVYLPKQLYHTNSSLNEVENFPWMSQSQQDSVIASLTQILDKIDDSIFLAQFNQSLLYTLSRTHIPIVVVDDMAKMPTTSDQHLTLIVADLEAEEFLQHARSDFYTKRGTYYAYDYDLRHFSTNAWFIFDNRDSSESVYFKNCEIQEYFRGIVTSIRDQKATMKGHFDRIDLNEVYATARELGTTCATLYIERILTEHVKRSRGSNNNYFFYFPERNEINVIVPYSIGIKESFEKVN